MKARSVRDFLRRRRVPLAGAAAVLLAAFEIFTDWDTWIQLNVSIVYGLPLVVAAASGSRRLLWGLAAALVASTFVVYAHQIPPGIFRPHEPFFVNRVLAAVSVLLAAGLLHALTLAVEALEARGKAAEEASGRKTRLLASVSHDLRTPLTTINLIADLIQRSADNPKLALQVRSLAEDLGKNALSLSALLSDAIDISSLDSGHVQLRDTEFSLNDLLAEECRRLERLAAAKGLWLRVVRAEPELRLRADRIKLGRVVRNLVNNAIKFTHRGGVEMRTERRADGALLVHVADTGVGIAAADLGLIFQEFAQLGGSAHARGWGLGLAICRRLSELMGGAIEVQSAPNEGSVFSVRLPAHRIVEGAAPKLPDLVR